MNLRGWSCTPSRYPLLLSRCCTLRPGKARLLNSRLALSHPAIQIPSVQARQHAESKHAMMRDISRQEAGPLDIATFKTKTNKSNLCMTPPTRSSLPAHVCQPRCLSHRASCGHPPEFIDTLAGQHLKDAVPHSAIAGWIQRRATRPAPAPAV